jgi:hypothetical protein
MCRAKRLGGAQLVIFALMALAAPKSSAADLWAVLTDNAEPGEPAIQTGVTYVAEPAFTNPADSTGRRLVDRGGGWNDWNNTVGVNYTDQTVTFRFPEPYRVGRIELQFDMDQKPAYVDISVAETDGPSPAFEAVGRITPGERNGWYELALEDAPVARQVAMFFRLKEWGWYLREVKIWGTRANEPGPDELLPSETEGGKLVLVRNGRPRASIIVAAEPAEKVLAAARDLQDHIYRMSGAVLPIRTDERRWTGTLLLVGPSRYTARLGLEPPTGYPSDERTVVRTIGRSVAMLGNDEGTFSGTQFAVQTLLERLGCGWFGPDPLWQVVPQRKTVVLPPTDVEHTPPFALRSLWNAPQPPTRWYLGGPPMHCGHAHSGLFPPEQYFAQHPEYYALIGRKRTAEGEWQLCTSNRDVIRLTVEKARAFFDSDPEQIMFSLSNNDCGGFCECEACAATGSNPGARMLAFANAVAKGLRETHPDKYVVFLAYWYTHAAPPEPMKAEPGVSVMVVGEGCHAHAITDASCPRNVMWRENFERWAATGALMSVYEWYIPGTSQHFWRRLPWVAGETAVSDLRYWREHGVKWITYESQPAYEDGSGYPLRWPLYYVAARGMWDGSLSAQDILRDACRRLYGPAAEAMLAYYREIERAFRECPQHGNIWNLPDPLAVFTPQVQRRLRDYLREATRLSAEVGGEVQERLEAERALWGRAERTLREQEREARLPTVFVSDRPYKVDRATITGGFVRSLGGIPAEEKIMLVEPDGIESEVGDEQEVAVRDGMRFLGVPR